MTKGLFREVSKNSFWAVALAGLLLLTAPAHAADCDELAKLVGGKLPPAVPGTVEGAHCGRWVSDKNATTGGFQYLLVVNGQNVVYATYANDGKTPLKMDIDPTWDGPSLKFRLSFAQVQAYGDGTLYFEFKVANGAVEPSALGRSPRRDIPFFNKGFTPYPPK